MNIKPKTRLRRLYYSAGRLGRRILVPIWPDNCPQCGKALRYGEGPLCLGCLAALPMVHGDVKLAHVGAPRNEVTVRSWFVYDTDDASHQLIHDMKYRGMRGLARKMGREYAMHKLLDDINIDIILPIPLHRTKYLTRGYNQSEMIAKGIRDVTGVAIGNHLYAIRAHESQTHRSRQERAVNVKDIFDIRRPDELDGKHIAVLDDVMTTGATLFSALASILKATTPASVTFLSLARTRS